MKNIELKLVEYPDNFLVVADNQSISVSGEKEAEIMIVLILNAVALKKQYQNKYKDVVDSSETIYKGDLLLLENVSICKGVFIQIGEVKFKVGLPIKENLMNIIYRR